MDAGVVSAKIEGRLRTPEYAAAAVGPPAVPCGRASPMMKSWCGTSSPGSRFTDGYLTNHNDGQDVRRPHRG